MMESSNLDHQHQQELHAVSSSLPSPSFPLVAGNHEWNQNLIMNDGDFIPNVSRVLSSSRDFRLCNEIPAPPLSAHMIQDLGFHWAGTAESYMNQSAHQANLARIKEELSDSFPRLSGLIRAPSTIEDYHLPSTSCIKSEQQGLHELNERFFLRTFPSGCQTNGLQPPGGDLLLDAPSLASFGGAAACGRGSYSMVLPTANISSLNPPSSLSSYPVSLGMDLQALDLLASARFGRSFCEPSLNSMGLLREDIPFGLGHLHEPAQGPSNSHHKISSLVSGVTEAKRGNSVLEDKASQTAPKKPRFETRSSCSPFKVRKEKLGDRIAALQQLVAPFGKTDTASVLMEAIGYIKFLQDQVETLSVPYMRSSNKKLRTTQGESSKDGDEPKPDLKSRGLCLVPLSCTSYVTNENGGVWSPPNYMGSN